MARARLSAVLVVRNESRQIRECLRALAFADEIVVADCDSTDGTPRLARELGARVVSYGGGASTTTQGAPPPLIHAAKNFAFQQAREPWILNLDADERPSDALREEILGVLAAPDPQIAAYALPFTHYFFGHYLRHGGFRGPLIRLFRRGKLHYPEDRAHSSPVVDGPVGTLRNLVVHFNHPRISDFLRKMNLYTAQDAPLMARQGYGGLRGRRAPLPTRWGLLRGPLGVFWNRYVRHRAFLDGVPGLVAAALMASYQFVESAKLWEYHHREGHDLAPGEPLGGNP